MSKPLSYQSTPRPHSFQGWECLQKPEDPQKRLLHNILSTVRCKRLPSPESVRIDRWSDLSHGTFGEVHGGTMVGGSEPVAIKELRPGGNLQKRLRIEIAFARELTVWADLSHPNVLGLLAFYIDVEEGIMWFISPFSSQGNITTYLEVNDPDTLTRLQLSLDTANGLSYLHKKKICHGDLKGANVLIYTMDGKPKAQLCDFGLAKIAENSPSGLTTSSFAGKGTPRYLSPELLCDVPLRCASSDVWAWGCLFLEIITNRIPYETTHGIGVFLKILEKTPPADVTRLQVTDGVRNILKGCWNAEPAERPTIDKCCSDILNVITRLVSRKPSTLAFC